MLGTIFLFTFTTTTNLLLPFLSNSQYTNNLYLQLLLGLGFRWFGESQHIMSNK